VVFGNEKVLWTVSKGNTPFNDVSGGSVLLGKDGRLKMNSMSLSLLRLGLGSFDIAGIAR
jgi:hypothetical protein